MSERQEEYHLEDETTPDSVKRAIADSRNMREDYRALWCNITSHLMAFPEMIDALDEQHARAIVEAIKQKYPNL